MMKKLMILMVFGTLFVGMIGCHAGECWRYAWNSRFHPERNAQAQTCVGTDGCDPCGDGVPMTTTAPCPCGN